jgi:hypothetical protein
MELVRRELGSGSNRGRYRRHNSQILTRFLGAICGLRL